MSKVSNGLSIIIRLSGWGGLAVGAHAFNSNDQVQILQNSPQNIYPFWKAPECTDVINEFQSSITTLVWSNALRLVKPSQMLYSIEWQCFISEHSSYTTLKFVDDIDPWVGCHKFEELVALSPVGNLIKPLWS